MDFRDRTLVPCDGMVTKSWLCPPSHPRQSIRQAVRAQVSIAGEHLQRLVAADGADLHHVQVRVLEEAADGLVAEIVERQALNAGFVDDALPRETDCIGRHSEHRTVDPAGNCPEHIQRRR